MIITSIQQQKKNSERVSVFLDGEYAFGLDSKFLVDFDLYKGKSLDQAGVERIIRKDVGEKIKARVLNLIARRPRSEKEIRDYISQKFYEGKFDIEEEYRSDLIESVVDELKKSDYINDESFANWYVNNRIEFKPRGKGLLRSELKSKGIPIDIISEVLDFGQTEELKMAKTLASKKLKTLSRYDKKQKGEKLIDFLRRKGFSWDIIQKTCQV